MELGAFSISLAVKDIKASKAFYEKIGFKVFVGDISQNWLILKNGEHAIGLFPIQCLEPIHNPPEILANRQIASGQFLQHAQAVLSVVDRGKRSMAQQFR